MTNFIRLSIDWRVVKSGICDEDFSNNRLRLYTNKKPKFHAIRKRSYEKKNQNITYSKEFIKFKPQVSEDYKTPMELTNLYPYTHQYSLPQVYQTHFQNEPRNLVYSVDVINKLISKNLNSIPNEDQSFGATNAKPMQNGMNNMPYDFINDMKYDQEDPIPEPVLRPMDSNDYYPYNQPPPSYDRGDMTTTSTTTTTTASPHFSEQYKLKTQLLKEKSTKKIIECKYGVTPVCGVLSNGTVRTFENMCEMRSTNLYLKNSKYTFKYI